MIDDFMIDPVMGAYIIMGVKLDAFQQVRLRTYWRFPEVIDSSGFSTAKTFVGWVFLNMRCVLIGDQVCGVYYQTFSTGQETFWQYYRKRHHPIFAAQLGTFSLTDDEEGKANTRGAACYHQFFRNGSEVKMPAPSWGQDAKTQAGLRYNAIWIDEWTKIESASEGINKQIIGRLTRECRNQDHPIWANHFVLSATAETPQHPSYARYKAMKKRVDAGDPTCAIISFCYKDYSNQKSATGKTFKEQYRIDQTLRKMKNEFTEDHYRREVCGLWTASGSGWYSEENVRRCIQTGRARDVQVIAGRSGMVLGPDGLPVNHDNVHFFLGVDPAPALGKKSDDGAMAVLRAMPAPGVRDPGGRRTDWQTDFVWARKLRGASTDEWSGRIHQKHQHFSFSGINLDAGSGGQGPSIMMKLRAHSQMVGETPVITKPICTPDDMGGGVDCYFILTYFKRGDVTVENLYQSHTMRGDDNLWTNCHVDFQAAIEHGEIGFPVPYNERPREETSTLIPELDFALRVLSQGMTQLTKIVVETDETGAFATTRNNAYKFSSIGKKDIAYAMMLAYIRFLIWLSSNEANFRVEGEDAGMCMAM